MIRNKKIVATSTETDNLGTYKKLGKGTLMIGGKLIRPGELFTAVKGSIPETFRDVIVEVTEPEISEKGSENPKLKNTGKKGKNEVAYVKVHTGDDLYDVFDPDGKKLTDVPISETEADDMIAMLSEAKV